LAFEKNRTGQSATFANFIALEETKQKVKVGS
jgi:hypothetical protein